MTIHFGKVKPGTTLYIPFQTFGSSAQSITLTGLAVTDIEIYKAGNVVQRASDAGYSLLGTNGIDFDGITGIHGFSVATSNNTTPDFFTSGSQFWVVVSSVTVDAQTVNFIAATFSLGYEGSLLDTTIATLSTQKAFTLSTGSTSNDAYNRCVVVVHDIASSLEIATGVISDYTGGTLGVTLDADPGVFTMAAGDHISIFPPAGVQAMNGSTVLGVGSSGDPWEGAGA
jgi:hypothetical protein